MSIGLLILLVQIPGCRSLKEKRSRLKPLLVRLRKEFNISAAEVDHNDIWQNSVIACSIVSNNKNYTRKQLQKIVPWIETNRPDICVIDESIELL
jgi:hypothetical protein